MSAPQTQAMLRESIQFDDFELDPRSFELRQSGRLVKLERIPLQLLFLLAEHRDRLVTREEILQDIWGKDVFVDADNSINTAVRKARQALHDDPENPRYLRTIPAKGYRFTATVLPQPPTIPQPPSHLKEVPSPASGTVPLASRPKIVLWTAVFAFGLLAVLAFFLRPRLLRSPAPTSKRVMLVVMPFLNLSGDPNQDYFADGMTEELITQLGSLDPQHLGVIARTSSMKYKGTQKSAEEVASDLHVDYLLEGSVRRSENHLRVTAQLIQSSDQTHLWAANFDRELTDVLKLQSDVAIAISGKIELALPAPQRARLAGAPQVNAAAYEAYLQGLHDWDLRTKPAMERAIAEFQRSLSLDPNYAPAHAALARTYSLTSIVGVMTSLDSMPKARDSALQAISLDPSLSAAHSTLGFVKAHFDFDWPEAQREYLRALELNPNDAYAHMFYSNSYLSPMGRHTEALQEMQRAGALDPFSAPVQSFLGRTYFWARQYDQALGQFKKCTDLFPGFALDPQRMARLYAFQGKFDDAITQETRARLLSGEDQKAVLQKEAALRSALAAGGAAGYWRKILELKQMPDNPPEMYEFSYGTAIILTHLGRNSEALDALETAFQQRSLALTELGIEPAFDPLHSEPRFQSLLRRIGLLHPNGGND